MRILIALIAAVLVALGAESAYAHAHLDHASPPVGATVQTEPHDVSIWFTQNLEPAFSTVEVSGPNGKRIDQGKPQISGNIMRVTIKAAGTGTYHVRWHAVSVDTHTTHGDFTFTVGGQ